MQLLMNRLFSAPEASCFGRFGFITPILVSLWLLPTAQAQESEEVSANQQNELEVITVTATRAERSLTEIAGTVSVINDYTIEQNIVRDIRDLIRYEPGITVSGGGRFGLSGFNIRGIGGDRVLTQIDGAPASDEFSFGPYLSSRRDFVDVDALKTVEIIRGPASSLYGSDALGGVVSFMTKDPLDYLSGSDASTHLSVKGGYTSEDNSWVTNTTLAGGNDRVQGMLLYTFRDGEQTENYGDGAGDITGPARSDPDPFIFTSHNVLAKVVFTPNDNHLFRFSAETYENDSEAQILSATDTISRGVRVTANRAEDTRDRTRFSLAHRYTGDFALFDRSFVQYYHQASESDQLTLQSHLSQGALQNRRRASIFNQRVDGIELQFNKSLNTGAVTHYVVYGIDYELTESYNSRDGGTVDAVTGRAMPEFTPLPTRDFPLSETTELSFYAQDEISLLGGRLLLTPGLRWDSFELEPMVDAVYLGGNVGAPIPQPYEADQVTAKLGAVFELNDTYSLFGQFAQGFRAPPYDDVNVGFTNLIGGYTTLPNPDLEAETSESIELGIRANTPFSSLSLTAFHNDYENFIQSLATRGFNPRTQLLEFQASNLKAVEISGVEFKGNWLLPEIDGLSALVSAAYSRGEDQATGQPVNTIDPMRAVFGLAYSTSDVWNTQLVLTAVAGQDRIDNTAATTAFFAPAGYATVDLLGEVNFSDQINLNFGVFNLTNRKYWEWGDVNGREPTDLALERFTRPGINASVSLRYAF